MPTDLFSIAATDIKMRFGDIYATEGMNAKLRGVLPAGIYRGFRLATHANALTVNVARDPVSNDSLAVYETLTGFSLTIRQGADVPLDLTAFATKTMVVTVQAEYTLAPTTVARLRVYELLPVDEFTVAPELGELVVLGVVVVPAAGVIPAANIRPDRRTPAWLREAPESLQWSPVIRNPSFEMAEVVGGVAHAARFWELEGFSSTVGIRNTAPIRTGSNVARFTGGALNVKAFQWLNIPMLAGRLVKVRAFVSTQAVKTGGTLSIFLDWGDTTGVFVSETLIDVTTAVDAGAFRLIETTISAPSGVSFLRRAGLRADALANVLNVSLDDMQIFVERLGSQSEEMYEERVRAPLSANVLILEDPTLAFNGLGALLRFDSTSPAGEGQAALRRKDLQGGPGIPPPAWFVAGRQFTGDLWTSTEDDFALKPRNTIKYSSSVSDQTYIEENEPTPLGSGQRLRQYRGMDRSFTFTINAKWRAAGVDNWTADDIAAPAYLFRFAPEQLIFGKIANTVLPWTDGTFANGVPPFDVNVGSLMAHIRTRLTLGDDALSSGDSANPRLLLPQSTFSPRTLNFADSEYDGVTGPHQREYMNTSGEWEITINAQWNGVALWRPDVAAQNATLVRIKRNGVFIYGKTAPLPGTWADAAWDLRWEFDPITKKQKMYDGFLEITSGGTSYPGPTAAIANQLRLSNLPKAWGRVQITNGPFVATVLDGHNVDAAAIALVGGAPNGLRIFLQSNMLNTNYGVWVQNYRNTVAVDLNVWYIVEKATMDPGFFDVYARFEGAPGGSVDLGTGPHDFSFLVFGEQA